MKKTIAFSAVLLALAVLFAAENALPGDLLYPVKMNANERVVAAVAAAGGAELRAQAALWRVGRRFEEAETLAVNGEKLSSDAADSALSRAMGDIVVAETAVEGLSAPSDLAARVRLTSSELAVLKVHRSIMSRISDRDDYMSGSDERSAVRGLYKAIEQKHAEAVELLKTAQESATALSPDILKKTAEKALADAQKKIFRSRLRLKQEKDRIKSNASSIELRLGGAEKEVVEGKSSMQSGSYADAIGHFNWASRYAGEMGVLTKMAVNFDDFSFRTSGGMYDIARSRNQSGPIYAVRELKKGLERLIINARNQVHLDEPAPEPSVGSGVKTDIGTVTKDGELQLNR